MRFPPSLARTTVVDAAAQRGQLRIVRNCSCATDYRQWMPESGMVSSRWNGA